jgi:hypothetical protein
MRSKIRRIGTDHQEYYSSAANNEDLEDLLDDLDPPYTRDEEVPLSYEGGNLRNQIINRVHAEREILAKTPRRKLLTTIFRNSGSEVES